MSLIKVTGHSKYPFISVDLVLGENITLKLLQTVIVSHCDLFPVVFFRSLYHFVHFYFATLCQMDVWKFEEQQVNKI